MSENLKVNANSSVLEHKRKHNLLVENFNPMVQELMENGEPMSGYSMSLDNPTSLSLNGVYGGIVKNGNKLTIALAINIIRTETAEGSEPIAVITIPNEIYEKLFTTTIGGYNCLSFDYITGVKANDNLTIPVGLLMLKQDNYLYLFVQGETINDIPTNTNLFIRYERTFLLSDNLISNE